MYMGNSHKLCITFLTWKASEDISNNSRMFICCAYVSIEIFCISFFK